MAENSKISWTDHTWNHVIGCTKVSPACANCYAERDWDKRRHWAKWGPNGTRVLTSYANWRKLLTLNRKAQEKVRRENVFVASLSDIFETWDGPIVDREGQIMHLCQTTGCGWSRDTDGVPVFCSDRICPSCRYESKPVTMDDVRQEVFRMTRLCRWLNFLFLTKRPENILPNWPRVGFPDAGVPGTLGKRLYLDNVCLGTTVESQDQVLRVVDLLNCRDLSPILFLSCEPLLGPLYLRRILLPTTPPDAPIRPLIECNELDALRGQSFAPVGDGSFAYSAPRLDGIFAGGESGPEARPSHPDWFRKLRDDCKATRVPFHFKQWGEWAPCDLVLNRDKTRYATSGGNIFKDRPSGLSNIRLGRIGTRAAGRMLDSREHNDLPPFPMVPSNASCEAVQ